MVGFILGLLAGAAGYWAYERYVVDQDDDSTEDAWERRNDGDPTHLTGMSRNPNDGPLSDH